VKAFSEPGQEVAGMRSSDTDSSHKEAFDRALDEAFYAIIKEKLENVRLALKRRRIESNSGGENK
jgi:hypothetical protein